MQGRGHVAYDSHDVYVNKTPAWLRGGTRVDPGSSNRYFSDSVAPTYPMGSAFIAATGGTELLPGHTDVWFSGHQDVFGGY